MDIIYSKFTFVFIHLHSVFINSIPIFRPNISNSAFLDLDEIFVYTHLPIHFTKDKSICITFKIQVKYMNAVYEVIKLVLMETKLFTNN